MNGFKLKYGCITCLLLILSACNHHHGGSENVPVARVFDNFLYSDDLKGVIPVGLSPGDSIAIARDYIDKWVRNQLILEKAELNLTEEEKNVEQQIENYRTSLLIYLYEQSYIREKLDTIVSDQEIEDYLNENSSNFILGDAVIKGSFIKVPVSAPEIYKLRQWCTTDDPENASNIESYCFEYADTYDHFNDEWMHLSQVLPLLPGSLYSPEYTIKTRRLVEMRDDKFYYFLNIRDYVLSGEIAPFDMVKENIRSILINKRKISIVSELESSIYNDGQNHDSFTIY